MPNLNLNFSIYPTQKPGKSKPVSPTAPLVLNNNATVKPPKVTDALQVETQGSAKASLSFSEEPHFIEHTVKRGETLGKLAKKHLGKSNRYMEIFKDNKDVLRNPNGLRVGMKIKIRVPAPVVKPNELAFPTKRPPVKPEVVKPEVVKPKPEVAKPEAVKPKPEVAKPEAVKPKPEEFTNYKVKRGDSLSIIALRHLGDSNRYMEIFDANRDQLKSPRAIQPGMVLKVPVSSEKRSDAVDTANAVSSSAVTGAEGLTPGAKELLGAMQRYQKHHAAQGNTKRTKTTPAEMREIAVELDSASKAFDVDPKLMLALYAHESGGINPRAKSHTGAGGLGQLTGIAIRQVHYMAGMAKGQKGRSPFTQHKSNFVQHTNRINQRYNIKANVWTSTAYMSYELKDRSRAGGKGVEKALKRYGDPHVSTYANKVNKEYRTLFGGKLF